VTTSTSDPRSTPPNVATGMANNTKKQCEKFDWVYAEEVQSSVGRAWWSYTVISWPGVCWTMINWLFSLILWSKECLFFNNKHFESISKSVTEKCWVKIHVLKYLRFPYAFLFLHSLYLVLIHGKEQEYYIWIIVANLTISLKRNIGPIKLV
jgi:hypothetical protein